jgi:hypothetical protein
VIPQVGPEIKHLLAHIRAELFTRFLQQVWLRPLGNPIQPSTWWQAWQKVRAASLTADQLASPLMKRPYDLRHSGLPRGSARIPSACG